MNRYSTDREFSATSRLWNQAGSVVVFVATAWAAGLGLPAGTSCAHASERAGHTDHVHFTIRSVADGRWSDAKTWKPARVPAADDRVLVARGTRVEYDVAKKDVIRMIQIAGVLNFARARDTELNVGVVKVQNSESCSESGFACDFLHTSDSGEPHRPPGGILPALIVGTQDEPIPAKHTARIRLHFLKGMDKKDAPAIACCSARMELHGSPLNRTWVKLDGDAKPGEDSVTAADDLSGWKIGDEVIITASKRARGYGTFRKGKERGKTPQTERRTIRSIDGRRLILDKSLEFEHAGSGEFRSEIANLSRNVIVESADPAGVRGHTVYHRFSRGGISYARFAHLGKEGVLGRYPIHFHLVEDTMRGSSVVGAAVVDSHNRWVTIHGTHYLVVRDCVGYQSVGHGFFLEDGTEVYNVLDRNLGVQAYRGKRLPEQALPFDENEGAAFWWSNGLNTITRNTTCENDEYGYRYDMRGSSRFDPKMPIRQPDGREKVIDVRTLPIWRFEGNEAHTEGFYGMVVAANGNSQPDSPISSDGMLKRIRSIDWTGPDARHPHVIRGLSIWGAHYGFRPHSPSMLMEDVRIADVVYGVYRPAFDNHVYRNLHLSNAGSEPFNRGMDDASAQNGSITVDGLTLENFKNNRQAHPLVHMTDNNLSGDAECHFRNVVTKNCDSRRPVFNRGGSTRVDPYLDEGVPYYIHDHYGPGRHAKIVSTKAADLIGDGEQFRKEPPLTGDESRVAEVGDVEFPQLLDPQDDLPPATIITRVAQKSDRATVQGVSHDNGKVVAITVNGSSAKITSAAAGVVNWSIEVNLPGDGLVKAKARDEAGNVEQTPHVLRVGG